MVILGLKGEKEEKCEKRKVKAKANMERKNCTFLLCGFFPEFAPSFSFVNYTSALGLLEI